MDESGTGRVAGFGRKSIWPGSLHAGTGLSPVPRRTGIPGHPRAWRGSRSTGIDSVHHRGPRRGTSHRTHQWESDQGQPPGAHQQLGSPSHRLRGALSFRDKRGDQKIEAAQDTTVARGVRRSLRAPRRLAGRRTRWASTQSPGFRSAGIRRSKGERAPSTGG